MTDKQNRWWHVRLIESTVFETHVLAPNAAEAGVMVGDMARDPARRDSIMTEDAHISEFYATQAAAPQERPLHTDVIDKCVEDMAQGPWDGATDD
jgi:hypothetical protein